ncbi:hypothetical protein Taro_012133 [Colocasia esculenta]|uniref:Uncharacterized protein n=1 Tax=Colocasia esculenta TaxID=4460 RepID=A0A843U870_COLES|nr:hypothetical protein [Colocasia esculenta]
MTNDRPEYTSIYTVVCALLSLVVRRLFWNTSSVGYPRFCVSQARVFVVLGVCPSTVCTVEVCDICPGHPYSCV